MPHTATTGFFSASRRIASYIASPPVVVPPGLLMSRITARTWLGLADLVEQLEHLAVVGDDAAHGHAGDVRQEAAGAGQALVAGDEQRDEEARASTTAAMPPSGEPPPETAAVDHGFGFEIMV